MTLSAIALLQQNERQNEGPPSTSQPPDCCSETTRRSPRKRPSDYIRENIVVTTSGICSPEPLNCALAALGTDRVMFAADYPFESAQEAGQFLDEVPLAQGVREDVAFRNAVSRLGLPTP